VLLTYLSGYRTKTSKFLYCHTREFVIAIEE